MPKGFQPAGNESFSRYRSVLLVVRASDSELCLMKGILATNTKSKMLKYLPLHDSALWVIEQLTTQRESPYLFPSPATNRPYTTIPRVWWLIRKKAGLPSNVRIHDLRHTFASRVVSRGRNLYEAQKLLGHADPRTTLRYAHLSMSVMQEASNVAAFAVG